MKSGLSHPKKRGHCQVLCEYFNEGLYKGAICKVQTVEKLEVSERTSRNAMNSSKTEYRKKRGLWIKQFIHMVYIRLWEIR